MNECRYSPEGLNRLINALLRSSASNLACNAQRYAYYMRKKRYKRTYIPECEIKHEINFILSDYFKVLTDSKVPQKDCVMHILNKYVPKEYHAKLLEGFKI